VSMKVYLNTSSMVCLNYFGLN